jgi:hypothetical protein
VGKKVNKNSEQDNAVNKDMNQLLVELGWINRDILSSYFALYGTILVVILRTSRYIAKLDEINKTNFAESAVIAGMVVPDIIETFPRIIDELFLVLTINSTELGFENLVNKCNLNGATESDISRAKEGLAASYFAYLAAKISYDLDVATTLF